MLIHFSSTIFSLPSPGSVSRCTPLRDGAFEPSVPFAPIILRGVSQEPLWPGDVLVHHVPGLGSGLHAAELHHLYYAVCELVVSFFPRRSSESESLLYTRADREAKRVDGAPPPRPVGIVVVVLFILCCPPHKTGSNVEDADWVGDPQAHRCRAVELLVREPEFV